MTQSDFDIVIAALRRIQFDDVGQLMSAPEWWEFYKNPLKFYDDADAPTRAMIWRLIERRTPQRNIAIAAE